MLMIKQIKLPQLGPPILLSTDYMYDYRPNWTPLSRVTITNCCGYDSKLLERILEKQGHGPFSWNVWF